MVKKFYIIISIFMLTVNACSENNSKINEESRLIGKWNATDAQGVEQVLQFRERNYALWIFNLENPDTLYIRYKLDTNSVPYHLDLMEFRRGPFKGHSLYAIVDMMNENKMKIDGKVGDSPDVRPESFSEKNTLVYEKID